MVAPLRPGARVLVRLPSWLGDLVQSEPVVRALVERDGLDLSLAAPAHLLDVFAGRFPGARRIEHVQRGGETHGAWAGHDVALLLTGSFRSAWTAWRARIPRRVGWSRDARGFLLTEGMRPSLERGATPLGVGTRGGGRRHLPRSFTAACVELAGRLGVAVRDPRPRLVAAPRGEETARGRLADLGLGADEPFLLVNVGARAGSAKGYPAGAWAELLDGLAANTEFRPVLVFGPREGEAAEAVLARTSPHARARSLAVRDPAAGLQELIALCARARLVVSADNGPRHLAAAAGAPVVGIFGPTDPRHGLGGTAPGSVVRVEVPCGPCHRERCPLHGEGEHACMRRIEPTTVLESVLALLGSQRAR